MGLDQPGQLNLIFLERGIAMKSILREKLKHTDPVSCWKQSTDTLEQQVEEFKHRKIVGRYMFCS